MLILVTYKPIPCSKKIHPTFVYQEFTQEKGTVLLELPKIHEAEKPEDLA